MALMINHIRILMHPEIDEQSIHNFLEDNNCRLIVRPHWITRPYQYSSDRIVRNNFHMMSQIFTNLFSVIRRPCHRLFKCFY